MNNRETTWKPFAVSQDAGNPASENQYRQHQRGADHFDRRLARMASRPGRFSCRDTGGEGITHTFTPLPLRGNKKGLGIAEAFEVRRSLSLT
jgi:hypothetical protein